MLIVATDEAGYGPKLGPLVISATAWLLQFENEVPAGATPVVADIESLFNRSLQNRFAEATPEIVLDDSKRLYKRKDSNPLHALELPIAILLRDCYSFASDASLRQLLCELARDDFDSICSKPWYANLESPFPLTPFDYSAPSTEFNPLLIAAQTRIIDPKEFNQACARCGNKATVLSEVTCMLASTLIERARNTYPNETQRIFIFSDRHGGRQRYASLLQHQYPETIPQIIRETPRESEYFLRVDSTSIRWRFCVQGDSFAPVAFSSMLAKYLRERLMFAFNGYWQLKHSSDLIATAGYPTDAERFCADIQETARTLGIDPSTYVRCR